MKRTPRLILALCLSLVACAPTQKQQPQAQPEATPPPWASAEVLETVTRQRIDLDAGVRDKLKALARKAARPGGTLEQRDLDLTGDGKVTRKELQFVLSWQPEQLSSEGAYRLQTQPRLLPNRLVTGMVQIHVNNPEQVRDPGLLFDTRKLSGQAQLHLGMRDQKNFEIFSYTNYLPLRQKYASKPGPDGKKLTSAWYAVFVHNPLENGTLDIDVAGSGYLNEDNPVYAARMLTQLPPSLDAGGRAVAAKQIHHPTRSNDADLQYNMLHPESHELQKSVTLAPGKSLLLFSRLPMQNGLQDYRGQFQFQLRDGQLNWPLQMQAAVLTALPLSPGDAEPRQKAGVLTDLEPSGFAPELRSQLAAFVEPRPGGEIEHLRQASDLSSPRALSAELRRRQLPRLRRISQDFTAMRSYLLDLPVQLPPWLSAQTKNLDALKSSISSSDRTADALFTSFLSSQELSDYISRGEQLGRDLERAQEFDQSLMSRVRGWNAEIKMVQRVLAAPDAVSGRSTPAPLKAVLGAYANQFWNSLFTLGRVNGVVRGNLISATLPGTDLVFEPGDRLREWNYVFNTNPYTTGGAAESAQGSPLNLVDAAGMLKQSANVASPPALSYGNYGLRYRIEGRLRNESDTPQPYDIRIGSPDEFGHLDWRSLFDQTDTLLGESSTRFTGTLRLTLAQDGQPPQSQEFSLIHGRVQAPQSLLAAPAQLAPGHDLKVTVELVVPTNSTAPQLLQFLLGTPGA